MVAVINKRVHCRSHEFLLQKLMTTMAPECRCRNAERLHTSALGLVMHVSSIPSALKESRNNYWRKRPVQLAPVERRPSDLWMMRLGWNHCIDPEWLYRGLAFAIRAACAKVTWTHSIGARWDPVETSMDGAAQTATLATDR